MCEQQERFSYQPKSKGNLGGGEIFFVVSFLLRLFDGYCFDHGEILMSMGCMTVVEVVYFFQDYSLFNH
jgi:hypothetical protein